MKRVVIIWHSKTTHTRQLVEALHDGVSQTEGVSAELIHALSPTVACFSNADLLVFATPENFGYMSGALKYFFDETYYEVEPLNLTLPYCVIVSAGTDGTNAAREIHRIMKGYGFKKIAEDNIVVGPPTPEALNAAQTFGTALAEGLLLGIY